MNSLPFSSSLPLVLFCLLFIMSAFPVSHSNPQLEYENCRDAVYKCGEIYAGYPFYGGDRPLGCGRPGLELRCDHDTNFTSIEIEGVEHEVLEIYHDRHSLRIGREDFIKRGFCTPQSPIRNSFIDPKLFDLVFHDYANVTLFYDCPSSISSTLIHFPCNHSTYNYPTYKNVTLATQFIGGNECAANVTFPAPKTSLENFLKHPSLDLAMEEKFKGLEVKWKEDWEESCRNCNSSGGACGFGFDNQTICYCKHPSQNLPPIHPKECRPSGSESMSKQNQVFTGLAVAAIVLLFAICFVVLRFKRKLSSNDSATIEAFFTKFASFAPNRYSYGEIKKMTDKFKDKLGQGGFGSVYKGKLPDGRLVAVKVLSETKGNGEDFMNEVASISRTSHVNIVNLLGFCFERSKRALIYEFMLHGSLDKFIYSQGSDNQSCQLEWKTLYDIALGIARGLEYLHQGCNTRILHFDIKPHNILLDENFCPKISDFGLSKLCERKESIISMAYARGTIGYIAPEVFCRNFGGVSYKSDVYSYGMMVLEIAGGRKNIDIGVCESSEVYFPSWIYKHLDQSMNLSLDGVAIEDEEIRRKLIIVSLWCIQNDPSDRPSMTKVLEMLQGSLESLVIPPRPFVSSPVPSPNIHIETSSII